MAARHKARLTIDELRKKSGVSAGCISEIEQDKVDPRLSTLQKLVTSMGHKRISLQF